MERFAQSGEGSGEFVGKGLRGGAEGEGDLEAGFVGGGEEFKLVGYLVGIVEPDIGGLVT